MTNTTEKIAYSSLAFGIISLLATLLLYFFYSGMSQTAKHNFGTTVFTSGMITVTLFAIGLGLLYSNSRVS